LDLKVKKKKVEKKDLKVKKGAKAKNLGTENKNKRGN